MHNSWPFLFDEHAFSFLLEYRMEIQILKFTKFLNETNFTIERTKTTATKKNRSS